MRNIFMRFSIGALGLMLLTACTATPGTSGTQQTTNMHKLGPLSYSFGALKDIRVSIIFVKSDTFWSANGLKSAAKECGTNLPDGHFEDLADKLKEITVQDYRFIPKAENEKYDVLLMSNKFGYASLEDFKKDFNVCAVGAVYPTMVNKDWLVFAGSCGGADLAETQETSSRCDQIQQTVLGSLKVN